MPAGCVGGSGPGSGGAAPRGKPAPPAAISFLSGSAVILKIVVTYICHLPDFGQM
jgi:hypothetical protein